MGFLQSQRSNDNNNAHHSIADNKFRASSDPSAEVDCKFYLRTGLCKFGSLCKYRHPPIVVQLNVAGLPIRLGEKECVFYLKTGLCKFGPACKFHHPQPYDLINPMAMQAHPANTTMSSNSNHANVQLGFTPAIAHPGQGLIGGFTPPSTSRNAHPNIVGFAPGSSPLPHPHPHLPLPPNNAFVLSPPPSYLPSDRELHNIVYGNISQPQHHRSQHHPPHRQLLQHEHHRHLQSTHGQGYPQASSHQVINQHKPLYYANDESKVALVHAAQPSTTGLAGPTMLSMNSDSFTHELPQRPGEPDCSFYVKTGICKFGMNCRYHHPKHPSMSPLSSKLSPMGLPLRPGVPLCAFYLKNGICKFGPLCKFDHPFHGLPSMSPPKASSVAILGSES